MLWQPPGFEQSLISSLCSSDWSREEMNEINDACTRIEILSIINSLAACQDNVQYHEMLSTYKNVIPAIKSLGRIINLSLTDPNGKTTADWEAFEICKQTLVSSAEYVQTDNNPVVMKPIVTPPNERVATDEVVFNDRNTEYKCAPNDTSVPMTPSDDDINRMTDNEAISQSPTIFANIPIDVIASRTITNDDNNKISGNTNNYHKKEIIVYNKKEFDNCRIIWNVQKSDNLYFYCLNKQSALFIMKQIILKKIFSIIMIVFGLLFFWGAYIALYLYPDVHIIYCQSRLVSCILATLLCLVYILSGNIIIVKSLMTKFDFWFKVYNVVCIAVSYGILYYGTSTNQRICTEIVYPIITMISFIIPLAYITVIEAIPISSKIKNIVTIIMVVYLVYISLWTYFYAEDVVWRPFDTAVDELDTKDSYISFQSIFIASTSNLILFMFKPVYSPIMISLSRKCCQRHDDSTGQQKLNTNTKKYERSSVLAKRVHLKWEFKELAENVLNQRIKSNTIW